jgi:hypothetical protein
MLGRRQAAIVDMIEDTEPHGRRILDYAVTDDDTSALTVSQLNA